MNSTLVWRLAVRYMNGKGSANAVPILSRISMVAIAVSSCAMLVLFSVFNGFEGLVSGLYKAFYPDIKVYAAKGKFFTANPALLQSINNVYGVQLLSCVLQDNVLVNNEEEQIVATLKGIDKQYALVNNIKPFIVSGMDSVVTLPVPTAIVGQQIASKLGLDVNNVFSRLLLYYPNTKLNNSSLSPTEAFQSVSIKPDGVFRVQEEFDSKYIIADISIVQELMHEQGKISSIELKLKDGVSAASVQSQLKEILGVGYKVETRFEQNKSVYMVMRSEKWAGYAILLFVLLIASFNMIGALSLLVLEKQKDIGILKAMGILSVDISRLILIEGALWSLVGGIAGIIIALILCFCQSHFHLIKIEGAFIIDSYPVIVQFSDILVVLITVILVGFVAALYPARRAAQGALSDIMSGK
jgi:lipoprotein-releasing system permease protein